MLEPEPASPAAANGFRPLIVGEAALLLGQFALAIGQPPRSLAAQGPAFRLDLVRMLVLQGCGLVVEFRGALVRLRGPAMTARIA